MVAVANQTVLRKPLTSMAKTDLVEVKTIMQVAQLCGGRFPALHKPVRFTSTKEGKPIAMNLLADARKAQAGSWRDY
jgi:hypothetical protein